MSRSGCLDHVELYVSDLARSTDFWGWLLTQLHHEPYQEWHSGRSWRDPASGTYLVLVQIEARFLEPGYHRCRVGLNHLAFCVDSPAQVDSLTGALRVRGVPILYPDRHPHAGGSNTYAVFFEDPDRMKVEVVARGPE